MATAVITQFWRDFQEQHPEVTQKLSAWSFGASPKQADELAQLVVEGKKRATSSLYDAYRWTNEPLPQPGNYSLILDGQQQPVAVIKTTYVEFVPYEQVTPQFAALEGEEDSSLDCWRDKHWLFFTKEAELAGFHFTPQQLVVCEQFSLVYTA